MEEMEEMKYMNNLSLKIPIMHQTCPYIYLRIGQDSNRYRISMNYKYLNEHYNLNLNFIRDLSKIHNHDNIFFKIENNIIYPKNIGHTQTIKLGNNNNNKCIVHKIIYKKTCIMVFERIFEDEVSNFSIFFASENINNINDIRHIEES